jgi:hypothetical protein
MKTNTIIGLILVILGILALAYPKISYTDREKIVDLGPIQATAETRKEIPLAPILGGVAIVGGLVLMLTGRRSVS